MEIEQFHSISIEDTFKDLDTNAEGLSGEEVSKRQETYGKNRLKEEKTNHFKLFFLRTSGLALNNSLIFTIYPFLLLNLNSKSI